MEHLRLSAASEKGTKKCKRKAKTVIFSWNFDLSLTFLMDCGHIYVPNGMNWGSTSRPHVGDVVMTIFLRLGPPFMTGDGPKMIHFGPKMAKYGSLVNTPKWSKRGPKGTKMVNLSVLDHLGPFWDHLDHLGLGLV